MRELDGTSQGAQRHPRRTYRARLYVPSYCPYMGRLELRCTADLSTWKAAAEARGLSRSRFVRGLLDDALGKELLAGAPPGADGTHNVPEPVVVSQPPDAVLTAPLPPTLSQVLATEPEDGPVPSWPQRLAANDERQS
jgi:hypothetical protein